MFLAFASPTGFSFGRTGAISSCLGIANQNLSTFDFDRICRGSCATNLPRAKNCPRESSRDGFGSRFSFGVGARHATNENMAELDAPSVKRACDCQLRRDGAHFGALAGFAIRGRRHMAEIYRWFNRLSMTRTRLSIFGGDFAHGPILCCSSERVRCLLACPRRARRRPAETLG